MNRRILEIKKASDRLSLMNDGPGTVLLFSLSTAKKWEQDKNQNFYDLYSLIEGGIPSKMRTFIWYDLLKSNVNEKLEKENIKPNYK